MEFSNLKFKTIMDGFLQGKKCRVYFENGYGASIVSHSMSYGGKDGLYEIAVLNKEGEIVYDTPITNDVIGYLTEDEVTEILNNIEKLPLLHE